MPNYEYLTNPALVNPGPREAQLSVLAKPPAPLVLVHDGGGTAFSYHLLDPINRPIWGIENARLHQGGWWDGGIREMAAYYVELLGNIMPAGGDILLGGWSLGGHLSLEMAHQIAVANRNRGGSRTGTSNGNGSAGSSSSSNGGSGDTASTTLTTSTLPPPRFRVLGIVMVDTIFPLRLATLRGPLPDKPVILSDEESKAMKLKDKVDLNMMHARMMVQFWEVPQWGGEEGEKDGLKTAAPPPTILLRAKEFVSSDPSQTFVDYVREYRFLGWDEYNEQHGNFIKQVVEVEGHHFTIFDIKNLGDVTKKISDAADALDPPEF
ncbi:alpha/beta-hydrolase [Hypoxylon sp. NC1633]|nr:alpha/beta-hydrolase [Hypoxylon sp. NC1633]